jgi:hypothetical protein
VDFIGQLESDQQLSTISSIELKEGMNGVTCSLDVWMPRLSFSEGGAQ